MLLMSVLPACRSAEPVAVKRPQMKEVVTRRADHGMVVSETRQASRVGRDILAQGGNSVDAAVATAFALAVTWPEAGNIGGGGFMMIDPGNGDEPVCIDYRETAPGAATPTMYLNETSRHNYRAVAVPGTVAGLALAHERYGKLPWEDLVMPSVKLARNGFELDRWQVYSINSVLQSDRETLSELTANLRRYYGKPDGEAWSIGDRMTLPELADTLELIAEGGPDAFYRGPIADQLVTDMQKYGGLISHSDLADYTAVERKAIHSTFAGHDVYGAPPPSSGGVTLILALNILEHLDLDRDAGHSAMNIHKITEAMRYAFRDRAAHLGDPDFVSIPDHLTTKDYAKDLSEKITSLATPSEELLGEIKLTRIGTDTTHFSVIDNDGMAVSNTYTLEQSWGSRMVVSGAGFVLNNEMGDFNWVPGETTDRGRVGTPANLIAPGKRMLSSQCPVILKRDGKVVLITGSPGGRTIINTVLGVVLNHTYFGMDLPDAVDAPRLHHQWFPDRLRYEAMDAPEQAQVVKQLRAMRHRVEAPPYPQGSAHSIAVTQDNQGRYIGVADKRRGGDAAGY